MRLCVLLIGAWIAYEMCQTAYRRKRGGRSRPIPRIITNRSESHSTIWTSNEANFIEPYQAGQSSKCRTKQKTADHSNLIQIVTQQTNSLAKFTLINAQSVRNKTNILNEYIVSEKIHIAAITETWCTPDDEQILNDITPQGYDFHHASRNGRRGGGVAIIAESRFKPSAFPTQTITSFETISMKISTQKAPLIVTTIYRPPDKPIGVFLTDFQALLEEMLEYQGDILESGDFNIHIDDRKSNLVTRFHDLLDTFSLRQHVDVATHVSGRTLDLIITRNSELTPAQSPASDMLVSDHFAVSCHIPIHKSVYETKTITSLKIGNIDKAAFRDDLQRMSTLTHPSENLDNLVNSFNTELCEILERHAPIRTRKKKMRPLNPWFDEEILVAKKEKKGASNVYGYQPDPRRISSSFGHHRTCIHLYWKRKKLVFIVRKFEIVRQTKSLCSRSSMTSGA